MGAVSERCSFSECVLVECGCGTGGSGSSRIRSKVDLETSHIPLAESSAIDNVVEAKIVDRCDQHERSTRTYPRVFSTLSH